MIGGGISLSWKEWNELQEEIKSLKEENKELKKRVQELDEGHTSRFKISESWFDDEKEKICGE